MKVHRTIAEPMCNCEAKVPLNKRRYFHTEIRELTRGIGLTEYQKEQQVERQARNQRSLGN